MPDFRDTGVTETIRDAANTADPGFTFIGPLAAFDFTGDGRDDLILGGGTADSSPAPGLYFLRAERDGGFTDVTAATLGETPTFRAPLLAFGDFTGDGREDVIVYARGVDDGTGNFVGEIPQLLTNLGGGRFAAGDLFSLPIHAKDLAVVDVDNDGDLDLFVESGGFADDAGRGSLYGEDGLFPHFIINDGAGGFAIDTARVAFPRYNDSNPPDAAGRFFSFRYLDHLLVDLNGDGFPDLVSGALRRDPGVDDGMRSVVVFNDGTGRFPEENTVELPFAPVNDGFAPVTEIVSMDLNGDCLPDLVFAAAVNVDGAFLQALINDGAGGFTDETAARFGDQGAQINAPFGANVDVLGKGDIDGDGDLDLFLTTRSGDSATTPFLYLNDGRGRLAPTALGDGAEREQSLAGDFNGDGRLDVARVVDGNDGAVRVSALLNADRFRPRDAADPDPVFLAGSAGRDSLEGGRSAEHICGLGGRDTLIGGGGHDMIRGGGGRDLIEGGGGRDTLEGERGRDLIEGGGGRDVLVGGKGKDFLTGGGGGDIFHFTRGDGRDVITDYGRGRDKISIGIGADDVSDLRITDAGADVRIAFANVRIQVQDAAPEDFSAADFLF